MGKAAAPALVRSDAFDAELDRRSPVAAPDEPELQNPREIGRATCPNAADQRTIGVLITAEHDRLPMVVRGTAPNRRDRSADRAQREWGGQESGRYEAALEAINGAIGAYTALIAHEEAEPAPDAEVIADAERGQLERTRHREQLDPADAEQITQTRGHFSQLAVAIRGRIQ